MPTSYLPSCVPKPSNSSPLSSMASPSSPLLSFPSLPISLTSLSTPSMASIVKLSSSSTLQASSSRIFSSQTTPRLSFHSHFTPSTTFHSISRNPPKLKKKKKFSSFAIVSALNKLSQSNSVTVPSGPDEFTVKIPSDSGVYAIYDSNNDFQFIGLSRSIAASVLSDKKSVPELCSSVKAGSGSFHEQNIQTTLEMMHVRDRFGDICENPVKYISDIEGYSVSSFKHENFSAQGISLSSWLKFLMLIGFSTLQDSHQALASSGFSNGLPSLPDLAGLGDISTGFASAFLLIFFSELGDKTFFIAALLAARNSGVVVFIGTFGALAAMSIISVVIGRTFHYVDDILPFRFGETDLPIDDIAAVCLLIYFGVSTLIEAASSDSPKAEEEQKEAEIAVSDFSGNGAGIVASASTVISTFVLVFVAEWGDKSFFSTIALSAASSPVGVIGGAVAGHGAATLLAVLGGSLLGTFLSEKVIAYVGGTLFLVFAVVTLIEIVT